MPFVAAFFAKYMWDLIVGGVILLVAVLFGAWVWHQAGAGARAEAVVAKAQATISQNDVQNADIAVQKVDDHDNTEAAVNAQTRANHDTIVKAAGANVAVSDAVDAAGRRAICMRRSAASLPECSSVQHPSP